MSKFSELVKSSKPLLVDFFAEWCGPCKMMPPILREVKEKLGEEVVIIKVDADKNQRLVAEYNVRGVPTLILFKDGGIKWKQSGVVDASSLTQIIRKHL